jgi:hypothetical protein
MHPTPFEKNVAIYTIIKGIGQFGLLSASSEDFLAAGALHQVAQNGLAIIEVYAWKVLLVDFSFKFGRFVSLCAA